MNIAISGPKFRTLGRAVCSYYDRYAYNYDYDYDYGYRPVHYFYYQDGIRYDCRFYYYLAFCG